MNATASQIYSPAIGVDSEFDEYCDERFGEDHDAIMEECSVDYDFCESLGVSDRPVFERRVDEYRNQYWKDWLGVTESIFDERDRLQEEVFCLKEIIDALLPFADAS